MCGKIILSISSDSNNSFDSSDNPVQSFDESQRCDGHRHCLNGKDEDPSECQTTKDGPFACHNKAPSGKPISTFSRHNYLDGETYCDAGADESPPFFSKIAEIKEVVYGNRNEISQVGISTQDAALGSMPLQVNCSSWTS